MRWTYRLHEMGHLDKGRIIEVTLSGNAANVQLLDSSGLQSYKNGRGHRYIGGLVKRSPVRLRVPHSGHWYVVVDLLGLGGSVRTSARVLPGALPPLSESPLLETPSLVQRAPSAASDDAREYDVFISHASEDKDSVVRPLALALSNEGLQVWYDEFELRIGDSLRRRIDQGLARSRVGLVVLSRSFIAKGWPNYELDGIITRTVTGEQVMLPIWHDITKEEIIAYSPSIADKVARSTAIYTVEEIAAEIADLLRGFSI